MRKRPVIELDVGLVRTLRHFLTGQETECGARAVFRLCRHHHAAVEKSSALATVWGAAAREGPLGRVCY